METKQRKLRIATYNIGTTTERLSIVTNKMRTGGISICALQETKDVTTAATRHIQHDGFHIYQKCHSTRANGVALVLSADINQYVEKVYYVSDRILFITVILGNQRVHFFTIYAPQITHKNKKIEKPYLWKQLCDIVFKIPECDFIYILGDFNGTVGSCNELNELSQGNFGFGNQNDDGLRLLEFTRSTHLFICNTVLGASDNSTFFARGNSKSQIDYVLTRRNHDRSVGRCFVSDPFFTGMNTISSHRPLIAEIVIPITGAASRGNVQEYDFPITGVNILNLNQPDWISFVGEIAKGRQEILINHQQFLNAPQLYIHSTSVTLNKTQDRDEEIDIGQFMDSLRHIEQHTLKGLATCVFKFEGPVDKQFTLVEVNRAIIYADKKASKFSTATAKVQNRSLDATELLTTYNRWLKEKLVEDEFLQMRTIPAWKMCNKTTMIYDHIYITTISYQLDIFDRVLYDRITDIIGERSSRCDPLFNEELIPLQQYIVRRLEEEAINQSKTLGLSLLRIENAYKNFPPKLIAKSLKDYDVPDPMINTILISYSKQTEIMQTQAGDVEVLYPVFSLRYGSPLSRLLIALSVDFATKDLVRKPPRQLGFDDRILLLSTTPANMESQRNDWIDALSRQYLRVSYKKSKSNVVRIVNGDGDTITQEATVLNFLGQIFKRRDTTTTDKLTTPDTIFKINSAWDKWRNNSSILRNEEVSLDDKGKIYTSLLRPTALHGTEWSRLTIAQERLYLLMEEKMLRYFSFQNYKKTTEQILSEIGTESILQALSRNRLKSYSVYKTHWDAAVRKMIRFYFSALRIPNNRRILWLNQVEADARKYRVSLNNWTGPEQWSALIDAAFAG